MKRLRFKQLFVLTCCSLLILIIPLKIEATEVPWSSESYRVHTQAIYWADAFDEAYGPPLPVTAIVDEYWFGSREYGYSKATASSMFIESISSGPASHALALATFNGSFLATDPLFIFTYTYSPLGSYGAISISDATTLEYLGGQSLSNIHISDTLLIPITVGHDINVSFSMQVDTALAQGGGYDEKSGTLTYGMAVAPEPLSSILFVAGGTLMAFRRYVSRKNA